MNAFCGQIFFFLYQLNILFSRLTESFKQYFDDFKRSFDNSLTPYFGLVICIWGKSALKETGGVYYFALFHFLCCSMIFSVKDF